MCNALGSISNTARKGSNRRHASTVVVRCIDLAEFSLPLNHTGPFVLPLRVRNGALPPLRSGFGCRHILPDCSHLGDAVSDLHIIDNAFGSSRELERKSSIAVLLPRLEIRTARRKSMRRAVSRLMPASCANHGWQLTVQTGDTFQSATKGNCSKRLPGWNLRSSNPVATLAVRHSGSSPIRGGFRL